VIDECGSSTPATFMAHANLYTDQREQRAVINGQTFRGISQEMANKVVRNQMRIRKNGGKTQIIGGLVGAVLKAAGLN
jgi:hypothetical protein